MLTSADRQDDGTSIMITDLLHIKLNDILKTRKIMYIKTKQKQKKNYPHYLQLVNYIKLINVQPSTRDI